MISATEVSENATADTGATVCCAGSAAMLKRLGVPAKHLLPTALELRAANGVPLTVLGVIPVLINTDDSNVQTRELLYIVKELQSLFLSKDA